MPRKKKVPAAAGSGALIADNLEMYRQLKKAAPELLGKRLRRARSEKKISQRDLTSGLFTSAYLSSIELGKTMPTIETLDMLASRLGEPISFFLRPAASQVNKTAQGELDEEQFDWMSVKHHLFLCELAITGKNFKQAALELEYLENNLATLSLTDQNLFHLLNGVIKNRQGEPGAALEDLGQLQLPEQAEADPSLAARTALEMGRAERSQGNFVKAIEHFHRGLAAVQASGKPNLWQQELLVEAGETAQIIGEFDQAANMLEQALATFSAANQEALAQQLLSQADEQARLGDLQQAAFLLGQSRAITEKTGEIARRQALALRASQLYFHLAAYPKARQTAAIVEGLAALDAQDSQSRLNEFAALVITAKISIQEQNFEQAGTFLNRAEALLKTIGKVGPLELSRYYQTAAEYFANNHHNDKAHDFYTKAITLLEPLYQNEAELQEIVKPALAEIYYEYSQLLKTIGEFTEAMDYMEKAYRLRSLL